MLHKMTDGTFFYHVPKTGGRAYKAFNCDKGNGNASSSPAAGDEKWDAMVAQANAMDRHYQRSG